MNNTLKVVIGVAAALVVGLVVGYVLGMSGKRDLTVAVRQEQVRAKEAEGALKQQADQCERKAREARTGRHLLLCKEQLLRATGELYANNYGLTSQHLAGARRQLKSAMKGLKGAQAKEAENLHERIGGAQTLAMRLDPMARIHIEQILAQLQKLPGAH